MGAHVAQELVRGMIQKRVDLRGARVLILGLTFKENTPDLRNTRVVDDMAELQSFGITVDIHDPWVDPSEAKREYDIDVVEQPLLGTYDGIVLAVGHDSFRELGAQDRKSTRLNSSH